MQLVLLVFVLITVLAAIALLTRRGAARAGGRSDPITVGDSTLRLVHDGRNLLNSLTLNLYLLRRRAAGRLPATDADGADVADALRQCEQDVRELNRLLTGLVHRASEPTPTGDGPHGRAAALGGDQVRPLQGWSRSLRRWAKVRRQARPA